MLETTLSSQFNTGTNLTGGLASAAWRFLLPGLEECDKVLCLGAPAMSTLAVLSAMSRQTEVISDQSNRVQQLQHEIASRALANVSIHAVDGFSKLPGEDGSVSLLFITFESSPSLILRNAAILREISRLLKNDGVLYFEINRIRDRSACKAALLRLRALGFGTHQAFWLTPTRGELSTAFPLNEPDMADYLFTNVLFGQTLKNRVISRLGTLLSRSRHLHLVAPRQAFLLRKLPLNGALPHLPQYLEHLARNAGYDVAGIRYGLSARGKYNANKTIFYLFRGQGRKAEAVVKMTRAAAFNHRLENEYRALVTLKENEYADPSTYPEALFFGYHAGMAVLGQKAVHGKPFRRCTSATVNCPIVRDAIDWIVGLGEKSANTAAVTPAQAGQILTTLQKRFVDIYQPAQKEREFLSEQIEIVARATGKFPTVFQHGDPGLWNILVSDQSKVIVIDWEAGEVHGMPLWDFFYFIRSYASWMCRDAGNRNSLESFKAKFLNTSDITPLVAETIDRYCGAVGLDKNLVAPLFYTCWMHRALKESTRLTKESLDTGHYFNLVRLCANHKKPPFLS